jgi:hypothetical protein
VGFLLMARIPSPRGLEDDAEFSEQFVILVGGEEGR